MVRQSADPLVSIIVPSYNQGRFIEATLLSCLQQDYRPIEILVMDGGSTDETVDVLKSIDRPEIRWTSERDGGVTEAVNKGLTAAKGQILSIQSSDDQFEPGAVAAAVEAMESAADLGLVYGDVTLIDQDSSVMGKDQQGTFDLCAYLGRFAYIPQPGAFFRREAWAAVGGWRNEVSYAADADFWLRIALRFPVKKLDRMVGRYRYHGGQRDKQRRRIVADWERMIGDIIASGGLDERQKRWARMGVHLAQYRYLDESEWWPRTKSLYAAALANPEAALDRRFPKRELLPGREPVWKWLSRVKRGLGFKPRGSQVTRVC